MARKPKTIRCLKFEDWLPDGNIPAIDSTTGAPSDLVVRYGARTYPIVPDGSPEFGIQESNAQRFAARTPPLAQIIEVELPTEPEEN